MENLENPSRAQLRLMIQSLERRVRDLEDRGRKTQENRPESLDEIVWKVGDSSIIVKKDSIVFKSYQIDLSSSGNMAVKAGGELVLKGAKIREN